MSMKNSRYVVSPRKSFNRRPVSSFGRKLSSRRPISSFGRKLSSRRPVNSFGRKLSSRRPVSSFGGQLELHQILDLYDDEEDKKDEDKKDKDKDKKDKQNPDVILRNAFIEQTEKLRNFFDYVDKLSRKYQFNSEFKNDIKKTEKDYVYLFNVLSNSNLVVSADIDTKMKNVMEIYQQADEKASSKTSENEDVSSKEEPTENNEHIIKMLDIKINSLMKESETLLKEYSDLESKMYNRNGRRMDDIEKRQDELSKETLRLINLKKEKEKEMKEKETTKDGRRRKSRRSKRRSKKHSDGKKKKSRRSKRRSKKHSDGKRRKSRRSRRKHSKKY